MTPDEKTQVRNEAIDELCDWLHTCIEAVDHSSETYKACTAMVVAMRGKKTSRPLVAPNEAGTVTSCFTTDSTPDTSYPNEKHYPLSNRSTVKF